MAGRIGTRVVLPDRRSLDPLFNGIVRAVGADLDPPAGVPDPSPARSDPRSRVLITDGDNVGVIAMVRGLARAGYEPWIAATHRTAPAAHSRAVAGAAIVPDPSTSSRRFGQTIAELAKIIKPVAVLPGGEAGMLALADLPEAGPVLTPRLAVCDREVVYRATDKVALSELAARAGLAVPETIALTAEDAVRRPLPVALPAVVKPLRSQTPSNGGFCSGRVCLAASRVEVIAALRSLPGSRGLVQRYHAGALSAVGGVFWNGEVVAAVHQRALRTWPRGCGEMACAISLPRDASLESQIACLLSALGWSGLFQLQFLETEEGRLLIDLNPRVYGSLSLALAAGQNLPAMWLDLLQGLTTAPATYHAGVYFRNELLDARALLAEAKTTPWRTLAREIAAPSTAYAFHESGDYMPLFALAATVARTLRTRAKRRLPGTLSSLPYAPGAFRAVEVIADAQQAPRILRSRSRPFDAHATVASPAAEAGPRRFQANVRD